MYGGSSDGAPNYSGPDGFDLPFTVTGNAMDVAHSKAVVLYWLTIGTWSQNYDADTGATVSP
jgi:hypothetical protein